MSYIHVPNIVCPMIGDKIIDTGYSIYDKIATIPIELSYNILCWRETISKYNSYSHISSD